MTLARFTQYAATHHLPPLDVIFGRTTEMCAIRRKLELVSKTDVPVLLQGESGTGKELCAHLLHGFSEWMQGTFVKVSCPAIPQALLETELFGYEKGAFTGAQSTKRGRIEAAHHGTLFLDEVGSLNLTVQSKLLQLLQDGSFMRVGGHETKTIRTRLISAANRDLREQVQDGSFRLDFLYRINAVTIHLPPLRQRAEDLPELTDYFIEQYAKAFHATPKPLSRGVLRLMRKYDWPGNIRQLDNMVRGYVLMGNEDNMTAELMEERTRPEAVMAEVDVSSPISLKNITRTATHDLERHIILKVLKANGWNRQKTARWLHISYRSLLYKLNDVGITDSNEMRKQARASESKASTLRTGLNAPGVP